MGKLLVDVDREALERVRVKLGARSHAEALRRLVAQADIEEDQEAVFQRVAAASTGAAFKKLAVAVAVQSAFTPHPKPGKR